MLSGILLFNQKGENLIFRSFRTDCRPRLADVFRIQVISNAQVRSPILTLGSTTFSHVKHENIYVVAVTKGNANAALVFEFLGRLVQLGRSYFGKFDEEAVKNNFVLVYELLDEILDFGYPQNTETDTLKMYITTEGVKSERAMEDSSKITMQATGALSWRRADIKYRKNEAFVDVIEDVNLLMSSSGTVLRADVAGQIVMRAYLSGTPECKFGLNDRLTLGEDNVLSEQRGNQKGTKATKAAAGSVSLEDCQFHQCVKLGKFEADRIISFVPPDGEFELMRYRATENVNLPFKVHAIVNEIGKTKVEYSIAIRANYGPKLFATNVVVRIPVPLNTAKISERTSQGKAKYEPEGNNIVWKIPRFTGQSEYVLSAEAELSSMTNQKAWSRPPLSLSFSLLMFTSSGLLVRYLKVFEKSNYSSVKWVRYMTRAGNYEIRQEECIAMDVEIVKIQKRPLFPSHDSTIVTINVGPNARPFHIHRAPLCRWSEYFRGAFEGSFREAEEKALTLDDVSVKTFVAFTEWLYMRALIQQPVVLYSESEGKNCGKYEEAVWNDIENSFSAVIDDLEDLGDYMHEWAVTVDNLLSLYIFADKYDVIELRRDIMDTLIHWGGYAGDAPDVQVVLRAYETLPHESGFCRFLVKIHGTCWNRPPGSDYDWDRLQRLPREFLIEIISYNSERITNSVYDRKPVTRFTDVLIPCRYHEHKSQEERHACRKNHAARRILRENLKEACDVGVRFDDTDTEPATKKRKTIEE
ncbi:clathrin associated protein complex medium subunit [Coniosporium tulheliwenetii]|uniref:Clathrin associated protein complex medium subunit n=1 Tax=Coniosporium tulheliwenetii TaxID=3383036 RepID=A0ACC2Z5Z6_9PEZI|nr:clathrin associated protein complex medium subunit [Cladosporium sp. JES 115]